MKGGPSPHQGTIYHSAADRMSAASVLDRTRASTGGSGGHGELAYSLGGGWHGKTVAGGSDGHGHDTPAEPAPNGHGVYVV